MDLKRQDLELAEERRKDYLRRKVQKPKPLHWAISDYYPQ